MALHYDHKDMNRHFLRQMGWAIKVTRNAVILKRIPGVFWLPSSINILFNGLDLKKVSREFKLYPYDYIKRIMAPPMKEKLKGKFISALCVYQGITETGPLFVAYSEAELRRKRK